MKNVMVCGFEYGDMMQALKRMHEDKHIVIKRWLYEPNDCEEWFKTAKTARAKTSFWRGDWTPLNKFPSDNITREVEKNMSWIMQEFARYTEFFRETVYEYRNIINHMVNEFYNELWNNDIDIVIFPDIPHGPFNALLYIIARAMGIDTLYTVSIGAFQGHFVFAHTIEDYGRICQLPNYHDTVIPVHIEQKYEKEWSYMTKAVIKRETGKDWYIKGRLFLHPIAWLKERNRLIVKNFDKYDSWRDYIERRLIYNVTKMIRTVQYKKNRKRNIEQADMGRDFVYIPLHLQPEMTVDTIGGVYRDQLLMVEKVRNIIPDDWYIYVKENPKQLANVRDKFFFKRLKAIKNVVWVAPETDTYELIRKSRFVATVTGTAAWESITGGKPALVFGVTWFGQFPGIIRYNEGITWEKVVNCSWQHDDLERVAEDFRKKLCDGVWLTKDIEKLSDVDRGQNINNLYRALIFALK